ncbi:MAG: DUF2180 family protein [Candidatus Pacearchaeota archaeon]
MVKKCIYCSKEIKDERVMEVCDVCGVGVWGHNMFKTIKNNMEEAREKGNI